MRAKVLPSLRDRIGRTGDWRGGVDEGHSGDMTDEGDRTRARAGRGGRGERTLTASEAAALIGVSVATVRGWADQGRLPSHRTVGGHRRFELEELREWLTDRGAPAPEPRGGGPPPPARPPPPPHPPTPSSSPSPIRRSSITNPGPRSRNIFCTPLMA